MDEQATDDPFHIVLFSDIREVLEASLPYEPAALVNAFLCFFNLPSVQTDNAPTASERQWRADPFIRDLHQSSPNEPTTTYPRNTLTTTSTLFAPDFFPTTSSPQYLAFLNRALIQLAETLPTHIHLAEYLLAFQATFFPLQAPATAKILLRKRQPTDIRLWNALALVEARLGRAERAGKVWSASVEDARSRHGDRSEGEWVRSVAPLVRDAVWFEIERCDRNAALRRLVTIRSGASTTETSVSDSPEVSPAEQLAAQRVRSNLIRLLRTMQAC